MGFFSIPVGICSTPISKILIIDEIIELEMRLVKKTKFLQKQLFFDNSTKKVVVKVKFLQINKKDSTKNKKFIFKIFLIDLDFF